MVFVQIEGILGVLGYLRSLGFWVQFLSGECKVLELDSWCKNKTKNKNQQSEKLPCSDLDSSPCTAAT